MKKLLKAVLSMVLVITLVACGGGNTQSENSNEQPADKDAKPAVTADVPVEEVKFEQPILLTSVGQSADVEMVKAMIENIGLDYAYNNLATSDDIGEAKTLILAVGGSSKGLGAAGIDADGELERVNELVSAAKEKGLNVLAVHIGGEARRGELSDKFIAPSFESANYGIVVEAGDTDGLMAGIASEKGIGLEKITSITDTAGVLEKLFQ